MMLEYSWFSKITTITCEKAGACPAAGGVAVGVRVGVCEGCGAEVGVLVGVCDGCGAEVGVLVGVCDGCGPEVGVLVG